MITLKHSLFATLFAGTLFSAMAGAQTASNQPAGSVNKAAGNTVDIAAAAALARKGACLACHSTDNKVVGPAYKDIAKKYANDPKAAAYLAKKIRTGGAGVWGSLPMPPQRSLSDGEIDTLVKWILAGAPRK